MTRNADYWDPPRPYLDRLVISDINDETAQINALLTGQVDAIDFLTAGSLAALTSSSAAKAVISENTGGYNPFTMRVDRTPYTDVRVRTALKLLIDRPAMLKSVFAGHGQIGNDIPGRYDPAYDPSLVPQREQDIDKAESLLRAAGYPDLSVQLVTTANAPGMVQAAQVFATQAAAAGVRVAIVNQPVTQYFANSYLKVPFSQDYWGYWPYLMLVNQATLAGSAFNRDAFQ